MPDGAGQGGRCGRSGILTQGRDIRQSECATVCRAEFQDPDRPWSQLPTVKSSRDSADMAEDLRPRGDPNAPSALTGIWIHRSLGSFPAAVRGRVTAVLLALTMEKGPQVEDAPPP